MTERDYDRMLAIVQDALTDDAPRRETTCAHPIAANDNSLEWPLEPFPEGWTASP